VDDIPRVLILTGYTELTVEEQKGHNFEDNTSLFKEVFDFCLPSKERYAKKHGYDFMCLRSFGEDLDGVLDEKDAGPMRVVATFQMVQFYDYVFWVDGDSIITNDLYKVEDLVDLKSEDIVYYVSYDWPSYSIGSGEFSNGNFIVANNESTFEFYKAFREIGEVGNFSNEQILLNKMREQESYSKFFKIIDNKYLNTPSNHEDILVKNQKNQPVCDWSEESFLCHFTGLKNEQRLYILNKYFSEYK
jgi:hypothetical protein